MNYCKYYFCSLVILLQSLTLVKAQELEVTPSPTATPVETIVDEIIEEVSDVTEPTVTPTETIIAEETPVPEPTLTPIPTTLPTPVTELTPLATPTPVPTLEPTANPIEEEFAINNPQFPGVANGPTFALWNNNLDIINVAEMINGGGNLFEGAISVFSDNGIFSAQTGSFVFTNASSHVPIPQLQIPYGTAQINLIPSSSTQSPSSFFDGVLAQYRFAPDSDEVEFSKFAPYTQAVGGKKYMTYVTFQPSFNLAELENEVTVWAEVTNLDTSSAKAFTVNIYNTTGDLVSMEAFSIPPMGRFDVQAGHVIPGPANQGLVEVVPQDLNAPYITQLSRYGGDSPAGINPSTYSFGTSSVGNIGYNTEIVAPVSSGGQAQNWLIVSNTASVPTSVSVEFLDYNQNVVQSSTENIAAKAQVTFNADSLYPGGSSGLVRVTPLGNEAIIADSMFYFFKPSGSLSAAYITHAEPNYAMPRFGGFNSFLDQQNWIKLYNDSSSAQTVSINVTELSAVSPAALIGSSTIVLQPKTGIDAELTATLGIAISEDTFGVVELNSNSDSIFAQLLRIRVKNGYIDVAEGVPLR